MKGNHGIERLKPVELQAHGGNRGDCPELVGEIWNRHDMLKILPHVHLLPAELVIINKGHGVEPESILSRNHADKDRGRGRPVP